MSVYTVTCSPLFFTFHIPIRFLKSFTILFSDQWFQGKVVVIDDRIRSRSIRVDLLADLLIFHTNILFGFD